MALFVEDFITSRTVTSRCEIFLTRPNCIPDESGTKRDSNLDFLELYKFTPDLCQVYLLEIPDCDPDKFIFESTYSKKIHLSLILNKVKDGKLRYKLKSPRWHEVSFQQSNGRLSQFVIKITEEEESPWFQTFYDCLKNTIDLIKSENPVAPISTFVLVAVSDQDPFPLERKVNVTDVKLSKNSRIKSWVPQIFKRKPKNITRPHSVSGEGTDSKETNTKLAKRPNSLSVVSIPALDPRYRSHSDSNNNQSSFNDHNQSNNLSGVRFVQDRKSSCETSPQPFQPGAYTPGIAADFLQRSKSLEVIHLTANDNWALHKISPSDSEKEESPIQEEIPQRLESILESLKKEDLLREITIVENKETPKPMITPRGKSAENMAAKGDNLKKVAALLQAAISEGDQMTAQQCATNLAAKMAKVTITIEYEEPQSKDKEFSIKVYIEDKETAAGSINLKVKTTDTIRDLKNKMLLKHTFPIEIQRWIIGRRLPLDHETLAKCGVKTEGHSVYLYLVSAKSVGLTKEDFQNRMARLLKDEPPVPPQPPPPPPHHPAGVTGDYMSMQGLMTPQPPPSGKPMPGRQQSFPSPAAAPVSAHGAGGRQVVGPPAGHQIPNERPVVTPNAPIPPGQRINPNQPVHNLDSVTPLELLPSPGREPVMHPSDYQEGEPQLIQGWCCPACTFINVPTRPGCAICTQPRPPDYEIPDGYVMSEEERTRLEREKLLEKQAREAEELRLEREQVESQRNFENLLEADEQDLIPNTTEFECPVCFETIGPGGGVVLRECLHSFCKTCLMNAVQYTEEAILRCPFVDSNYSCEGVLQSREIKALVTEEEYDRFLQRSLMTAESQEANSFHCKTPDCRGWCIYEDHVNFFKCPVCSKENCLTCKAQHQSMNCKQYQEDIKRRASNDSAAKQTQLMIDQMMKEGNALKCPKCDVIVMKKDGCDWVKCSICKTEICWVTKGFRWGSHVLFALYEKDVSFKRKLVNLFSGQHNEPWYVRLNPDGAHIPVLRHDDKIITEPNATIDYIDKIIGTGPILVPDDSSELGRNVAEFRKKLDGIAVDVLTYGIILHPHLSPSGCQISGAVQRSMKENFARRLQLLTELVTKHPDLRDAYLAKSQLAAQKYDIINDEAQVKCHVHDLEKTFKEIEQQLKKIKDASRDIADETWLFGPMFTAADISLAVLLNRLTLLGLDSHYFCQDKHPFIHAYYKQVQTRPAFQVIQKEIANLQLTLIWENLKDASPYIATVTGLGVAAGLGFIIYKYLKR